MRASEFPLRISFSFINQDFYIASCLNYLVYNDPLLQTLFFSYYLFYSSEFDAIRIYISIASRMHAYYVFVLTLSFSFSF